ncbi:MULTISPECIES: response regulator [unclassified Bradyrhizobium]|uniref:response regulator n=1 Tax=unclassified Bradyrhizobium TaxID=2631580 RepID=UPI002305D403|nr:MULTISPECIES: response regulator [unclassified Bradyrhizobium]MDA9410700.1 chemotaxis protein CheY [Bradyrhizobium sp. CCBAU 45384]MDA9445020.1 chemotaxis protein CheY [Bradyrhizobium sp. CCBAU 51745]
MGQSKPIRPTALVVEDDDIQREMLALLLEESNFEVLQCEDAETAALALKARHPTLMVTDINLVGKMDGVDLAYLAQQQDADMRIIVISGHPLPRRLPPGARFLTKPVYATTLLAEAGQ